MHPHQQLHKSPRNLLPLVPDTGFEPARFSPLDPKSSASTSYANPAYLTKTLLFFNVL